VHLRDFVSVLVLSSLTHGCSFDRAGTSPDLAFNDAGDDITIDSGVDTEPIAEDTETPLDSGAPDGVADVQPDTAMDSEDVAADAQPGTLMISGNATPTFPVDLTAEGMISWAHWGFVGPDTFTRKVGTTAIVNGITVAPARYDNFPVAFSWSDGDPYGAATGTATGIYRAGTTFTFDFSVAAANEPRTLRFFVATDQTTASVSFTMTDPAVAASAVTLPITGTPPGAGHKPQSLSAVFRSPVPGARLNIRITKTAPSGNLSLFAATLR